MGKNRICESGFLKCGGFDYTYAKSVCSTCFDKKISLYVTYVMQKEEGATSYA